GGGVHRQGAPAVGGVSARVRGRVFVHCGDGVLAAVGTAGPAGHRAVVGEPHGPLVLRSGAAGRLAARGSARRASGAARVAAAALPADVAGGGTAPWRHGRGGPLPVPRPRARVWRDWRDCGRDHCGRRGGGFVVVPRHALAGAHTSLMSFDTVPPEAHPSITPDAVAALLATQLPDLAGLPLGERFDG